MKMKTHKNGVRTWVMALGLATGAIAIGIGGSFNAHAQFAVFDPINYVQSFLTQLRAVQSNVNEVQQIQRQLEQLKYMAENTKSLTRGDWDTGADAISRLSNVLAAGEALAVSGSDFDRQFRTLFPGYNPEQDFSGNYAKWNQSTRDSVLGAMRVANLQMTGIHDEQDALASLRAAVNSTTGQKEALDAANQIALNQVRQMQGLRELMVAQMQAEGTHLAAQTQTEAVRRGAQKEASTYHDPREGYTAPTGLCAVPPCR